MLPSFPSSPGPRRVGQVGVVESRVHRTVPLARVSTLSKQTSTFQTPSYVLVAFNDRPVGLLSHADGSGLLPEARPKLTTFSWEEIRVALMLDIGSN